MSSDNPKAEGSIGHDPAITLALAYAPASARPVFEDLFALDRRLADAVRQASEPIIAQMKLAWWRDRFAQDPSEWPKGEPLLTRLAQWDADVSMLGALVDGWERLLEEGPLSDDAIRGFGEGHVRAWAEASHAASSKPLPPQPGERALCWAYADLAAHCSQAEDAQRVQVTAGEQGAFGRVSKPLPGALRPFAVLGALGRRSLRSGKPVLSGPGDFFAGVRAGVLGR